MNKKIEKNSYILFTAMESKIDISRFMFESISPIADIPMSVFSAVEFEEKKSGINRHIIGKLYENGTYIAELMRDDEGNLDFVNPLNQSRMGYQIEKVLSMRHIEENPEPDTIMKALKFGEFRADEALKEEIGECPPTPLFYEDAE